MLDPKSSHEVLIENIDIGGPSMLRSSAKNFKHVTVLPSTKYYKEFIDVMNNNSGSTDLNFRTKMANQTFNETAYYDAMISNWMSEINGEKFSEKKQLVENLFQNYVMVKILIKKALYMKYQMPNLVFQN